MNAAGLSDKPAFFDVIHVDPRNLLLRRGRSPIQLRKRPLCRQQADTREPSSFLSSLLCGVPGGCRSSASQRRTTTTADARPLGGAAAAPAAGVVRRRPAAMALTRAAVPRRSEAGPSRKYRGSAARAQVAPTRVKLAAGGAAEAQGPGPGGDVDDSAALQPGQRPAPRKRRAASTPAAAAEPPEGAGGRANGATRKRRGAAGGGAAAVAELEAAGTGLGPDGGAGPAPASSGSGVAERRTRRRRPVGAAAAPATAGAAASETHDDDARLEMAASPGRPQVRALSRRAKRADDAYACTKGGSRARHPQGGVA